MAPPQWLNDEEMAAWRSLLRAHARLMVVLDKELQEAHDLSLGDYEVLVHLSECPEGGRRMSELAERLALSRSGMTRRLDGVMSRGLVERKPCPEDGRATLAVITAKGTKVLREAAPCHVAGVRRHMIDLLTSTQLKQLTRALSVVADAEDASAGV